MNGAHSAGRERLVLEAGPARLEVDPGAGGRLSSVTVAGDELLVTADPDPMGWGAFPMAPFAGRIRHGRFRFAGRDFFLPLDLPPHAIHGTVYRRPWRIVDERTIEIDLGPDWPFEGRVRQRFELGSDGLEVCMELEADEAMPGAIGWHPWFRRILDGSPGAPLPSSDPVRLDLRAGSMYLRDDEGIPTGAMIPPTPGPWDDCFTDLAAPPSLTWPGRLRLEVRSSAACWVVYDRPPHAVCVEPQTSPPDFVSIAPATVEPGAPLVATMSWRWTVLG